MTLRPLRRITALLTAASLALTLGAPASATAADVTVSIDPYPHNLPGPGPVEGFVTVNQQVAFDVTVTNNSGSTVADVQLAGGPSAGSYVKTYVVAGPATCSSAPSPFSCDLGNFAGGASPVVLRVVVQAPSAPATLTFTVTGSASGNTQSDRPGQSHGDEFTDSTQVEVVALFQNNPLAQRGVGAFIDTTGVPLVFASDFTGFGTGNPLHTSVTIPAFAAGEIPIGTSIWFTEFDDTTTTCPDPDGCVGQTLELHFFDGDPLLRPIRVEVRHDELRTFIKNLKSWELYHLDDDGLNSDPLFDTACTFDDDGLPTNAPCGASRSWASDDKDDGIAVVWLDINGYIRGG